ncbi:MAG: hypothetical protein K2P86_13450 [Xanthobacteraceae bacterium]|nr:hypothetical protein [Xanthobacteraceae bacterium]
MDADEIENSIDALESSISEVSGGRWLPVWDNIKTISAGFKGSKFPSRDAREASWARFQSIVAEVKRLQAEDRRAFESKSAESTRLKDKVIEAARDAIPISLFTESIVDVITLGMESLTKAALNIQIDERLETLKRCSQRMKDAWALFEESKRKLLGRDKAECFKELREAQEQLNNAWQQWKSWQSEQRQRRIEHRNEKRREFEGRVRERIANLNERRQRLYGVLQHKENHLEELYEKRSTARSDDFAERVSGWIEEEVNSISEIKDKLETIEGWIDEEKEKLRDD